jgi:hypothetical protein
MSDLNFCDKCDSYEESTILTKKDMSEKEWYIVQSITLEMGNNDFKICARCLSNYFDEFLENHTSQARAIFLKPFNKYLEEK